MRDMFATICGTAIEIIPLPSSKPPMPQAQTPPLERNAPEACRILGSSRPKRLGYDDFDVLNVNSPNLL